MARARRIDGMKACMEQLDATLLDVLARLGIDARAAVCTTLEGGLSNLSYKVELEHDTLVVRLRETDAEFQLGLAAEADLLQRVAAAGLGPALVGIDVERNALVTRHVQASPWSPEAARDPSNIGRAAALLHALHGLEIECRAFAPQEYAARYIEIVSAQGRIRDQDAEWADELLELARGFERRYRSTVLCHNDLVAANVLEAGALMLVDFEYAVRADPIVDLASLAAMNDYDAARRQALLDAYVEAGGARYRELQLEETMRLLRLMSYFWALGALTNAKRAEIWALFADPSKLAKGTH